jgi:hypothetical protein
MNIRRKGKPYLFPPPKKKRPKACIAFGELRRYQSVSPSAFGAEFTPSSSLQFALSGAAIDERRTEGERTAACRN